MNRLTAFHRKLLIAKWSVLLARFNKLKKVSLFVKTSILSTHYHEARQ